MTSEKKTRRRHSATMKARVLAQCCEPGMSVAQVAMAHCINATVVHRWRQLACEGSGRAVAKTSEFLALSLPSPAATTAAPADIQVELKRGAVSIALTWPVSAAAELAAWTRELLR
ncbi:MAG: transposase [Paucibacter sp.]|nr:transposase [Roseateles sp.]